MNLNGVRPSKNFVDSTGGTTGFQHVRDVIGDYLYKHQWTKGADNKYYDPAAADAYNRYKASGWSSTSGYKVPIGKDGLRSDIDWASNSRINTGPASLMSSPAAPSPDQLAQRMGFKNAAQALAYQRKQNEMRQGPASSSPSASSGSLLDQALAMHPAKLLGHVLDRMNEVMP